jgi:hypothetical protein
VPTLLRSLLDRVPWPSGWFNVLMFLCFAVAFVWLYGKRSDETMQSAHPA